MTDSNVNKTTPPAFNPAALIRRIQQARMHLLETKPFFALMLMNLKFAVDVSADTAYTNGTHLCFSPDFVSKLSDSELEFVLMHELMHVVLLHCFRTADGSYDKKIMNVATDITVNSNILASADGDVSAITLGEYGEMMHTTPTGEEGALYTAEQIYSMLIESGFTLDRDDDTDDADASDDTSLSGGTSSGNGSPQSPRFDSHDNWSDGDNSLQREIWTQRLIDATMIINGMSQLMQGSGCGNGNGMNIPPAVRKITERYLKPQTDWRQMLNDFVDEEITDYSFSPPDARFSDSDFFMPAYNEKEETVRNVLFMVDTSGSISEEMIERAYAEIRGAIDQYNGMLEGKLGFFDHKVYEPVPFDSIEDIAKITPVGGGGTDFSLIFKYIEKSLRAGGEKPSSIVILTDGYAPFPDESITDGIPVLWLINNEEITPPWGKVARIDVDK